MPIALEGQVRPCVLHRGVHVRRAWIAAGITAGFVMAARKPKDEPASHRRRGAPRVPAQRARTALEHLVDGDADLVIADQDAQDAHILEALDAW